MESCGEQLHQRAMRRTETAMKMAIATALVLSGLRIKMLDSEQLTTVLTCQKEAAPPETVL